MQTIWKFPLTVETEQVVTMPLASEILHVCTQNGTLCLWAKVTPGAELEDRRIWIAGTGHELAAHLRSYLGTFMLYGGELVLHAFEI